MARDPRALLWDAREAAAAVAAFCAGRSAEAYLEDRMLRSAVERQCEILGEALGRLARLSPELAARIPELPRAVAFRNLRPVRRDAGGIQAPSLLQEPPDRR